MFWDNFLSGLQSVGNSLFGAGTFGNAANQVGTTAANQVNNQALQGLLNLGSTASGVANNAGLAASLAQAAQAGNQVATNGTNVAQGLTQQATQPSGGGLINKVLAPTMDMYTAWNAYKQNMKQAKYGLAERQREDTFKWQERDRSARNRANTTANYFTNGQVI